MSLHGRKENKSGMGLYKEKIGEAKIKDDVDFVLKFARTRLTPEEFGQLESMGKMKREQLPVKREIKFPTPKETAKLEDKWAQSARKSSAIIKGEMTPYHRALKKNPGGWNHEVDTRKARKKSTVDELGKPRPVKSIDRAIVIASHLNEEWLDINSGNFGWSEHSNEYRKLRWVPRVVDVIDKGKYAEVVFTLKGPGRQPPIENEDLPASDGRGVDDIRYIMSQEQTRWRGWIIKHFRGEKNHYTTGQLHRGGNIRSKNLFRGRGWSRNARGDFEVKVRMENDWA